MFKVSKRGEFCSLTCGQGYNGNFESVGAFRNLTASLEVDYIMLHSIATTQKGNET